MPWVIRAAKSRRSILHVHFYTFWTRPDEGPLVARAGGALRMDHLQNGAVNVPLRLTGFKTSSPGQRLLSPRHQDGDILESPGVNPGEIGESVTPVTPVEAVWTVLWVLRGVLRATMFCAPRPQVARVVSAALAGK
ncbi:hypothetical protein E8E14_014211 [Neopestalotiopsis sp. 37M]|nr:hypothetical protein E8E14_014211 [Neopestalotiopsis sp. 37M]